LYQKALQRPTLNAGFLRRLNSVHAARPQSAHGALENPTALPKRSHTALSNTLCKRQATSFILSMRKTNAAAWRPFRLHSAHIARTQRCWRLKSAHLGVLQFLEHCENDVKTPLWCDRGFQNKLTKQSLLYHTKIMIFCHILPFYVMFKFLKFQLVLLNSVYPMIIRITCVQ